MVSARFLVPGESQLLFGMVSSFNSWVSYISCTMIYIIPIPKTPAQPSPSSPLKQKQPITGDENMDPVPKRLATEKTRAAMPCAPPSHDLRQGLATLIHWAVGAVPPGSFIKCLSIHGQLEMVHWCITLESLLFCVCIVCAIHIIILLTIWVLVCYS